MLYLESLSILLAEEATVWSESHANAIRLLNEPSPTQQTVDQFKALLCERFPAKSVEIASVPFDIELSRLHQQPDEPLSAYYRRTINLMQRVGAKDRPLGTGVVLIMLESATLNIILRAFIRGFNDMEVRKEAAARGMTATDRFLCGIYHIAEEAERSRSEL